MTANPKDNNSGEQTEVQESNEGRTVHENVTPGEGKGRSFWRKLFGALKNKYLIATVAFTVWVFFIDSNNLINWYRDLKTVSEQRRLKRHYVKAIQYTDEKLRELSSNKDSLERFAREQYFFHEDGEDVFIVE